MTCSPWQKLHLGLTVATHDDRLAFGYDFASIFLAEIEPALVIGSSTWHRWAIKSNSCLSDGSSLPTNEVCHSRNVSESSFKRFLEGERENHLNASWNASIPEERCKCFVAVSESLLSSTAFFLVIVGKSNIALTWIWTITRLLSYRSLTTRP